MIRFKYALIGKRKPITGMGCLEFVMDKNQLKFLEELTDLSHKHGIYLTNILDEASNTKDDIYMAEIEGHMNSAGYELQENGSLVFTWY